MIKYYNDNKNTKNNNYNDNNDDDNNDNDNNRLMILFQLYLTRAGALWEREIGNLFRCPHGESVW